MSFDDLGRPADLRLLTWNVEGAKPRVAQQQAKWLASCGADLFVLTGCDSRHEVLQQTLQEEGLSTLTSPAAGTAYAPGKNDHVVLAARGHQLTPLDLPPPREHPHRCLAARLTATAAHDPAAPELYLAGLYVPWQGGYGRRHNDKRAFRHAGSVWLPRVLAAAGDQPLIVAGDMNVLEPGEVRRYEDFGPWECDFYWSWARMGLSDAYRALHPTPGAPAPRWFGRRHPDGERFDQIWVSQAHEKRLSACEYDDQPSREGLSTRPALGATLDFTPLPSAGPVAGLTRAD